MRAGKEEFFMKRMLSLALVLVMVLLMLPSLALAANTIKIINEKEFRFKNLHDEETVFSIKNIAKKDLDITVTVRDEDTRKTVQTMNFIIPKGETMPVKAYVYKMLGKEGEVNVYRYTIKVKGNETKTYYYAQKLTIIKGKDGKMVQSYKQIHSPHYYDNTASSFGPHFRDVTPNLTDKWYMFTPINLSIQGRQTFPLVASNIYQVGEVHVDVNGDSVYVSYTMFYQNKKHYNTEIRSEYLNFYNSYNDVTVVEPEDMGMASKYAFNRPFSIQNDLGGDTNVLMFVRNRLSYYPFPSPKSELRRFWENQDEHKARREAMLNMMDPIAQPTK